ncbi:uncharacterized protein CELE_C05B5.17 [Caenorhabditis elegans]|uniref:Uncharacterized protein n=1 Tax=Caenorhabditis elegans TaxID=6239 RepID=H2FLF7_CAEEL|nr:Uncharacterized protein CELE_C05B5.17 [Caenorhabditis elegans]CCF23349.1 Uncharacterized protein CELE_C05B5.17 [Caenorhabditis elegans]|eukprot:NP_001255054.1 Uncharacterized protein CELE_C05B5.17 [Caenorhabditis elegans]
MTFLKLAIQVLRIPFLFFIAFRAFIIPKFIFLETGSYVATGLFSAFHLTILWIHMNPKSLKSLYYAYIALTVLMLTGWFDFVFRKHCFLKKYGFLVAMGIAGNVPNSREVTMIIELDMLSLTLTLVLLYLQLKKSVAEEFVFPKQPKKSIRGPVCFTNTLTEDNEGYFENIYGDLIFTSRTSNTFSI